MEPLASQLSNLVVRSLDTRWAALVPLVHFPAGHTFAGSSARPGVVSWPALSSPNARGENRGPSHNAKLSAANVFFFAGCAAFTGRGPVGDCALYLRPSAETGSRGSASPFDSGALLAPRNFLLEPWFSAGADEPTRVADFDALSVDLGTWRTTFRDWLGRCYDEPRRYLNARPDRQTAGRPDVSVPAELATSASDRRAWTWEVRIEGEVSFAHAGLLHVPQAMVPTAQAWARERGLAVVVASYETADEIPSPDDLFRARKTPSGRISCQNEAVMNIEVKDGRLVDVDVVGFHGLITRDATPQRKAPIYRLNGSPVRIEGTPWAAKASGLDWFFAEPYESDEGGESVVLDGPGLPARVAHAFLILGAWEQSHLGSEDAGVHPTRDAGRTLVASLPSGTASEVEGVVAIPGGDGLLAWYAPMADLNDLLQTVRRRAKELFFASDIDGRRTAAWKLFQAAPGQREDMLIAAAMLQRHDFDDWRDVVASVASRGDPFDLLAEGQKALDAMTAARRATEAPAGVAPRHGVQPLSTGQRDYRKTARQPSVVGSRRAAA